MSTSELLGVLITITLILTAFLVFKTSPTVNRGGKILAFLGLFVLPVLIMWLGTHEHIERSKQTAFCLSCHEMEVYVKSLYINDKKHMPAVHFQNNQIPPGTACYACHTDYTMYGDLYDKLRGFKHLYVHYLGTIPDTLALYGAYHNQGCLTCHAGARSFEEQEKHTKAFMTMQGIKNNTISCMDHDCHAQVHDLEHFDEVEFWEATRSE